MADTRDDYEIGALLGAPVRAIQQAQIEAEREFVQFMLDYGMEETSKKVGNKTVKGLKLREFEFGMTRSLPDVTNPGQVIDHESKVRAPLLSIIQMPAVGIDEATIDLNLDVEYDREETEKSGGNTATAGPRAAVLPSRAVRTPVIKGSIGNGTISKNFRTQGKLAVSLKLRSTHDDDLHGRLSRLIGEGLSTGIDVPQTK